MPLAMILNSSQHRTTLGGDHSRWHSDRHCYVALPAPDISNVIGGSISIMCICITCILV